MSQLIPVCIAIGFMAAGIGWGAFAVVRMLQISIALNIAIAQELHELRKPYPQIPNFKTPLRPKSTESKETVSGEYYPYDEVDLENQRKAEEATRRHVGQQGGLTDDELQAHLAAQGATLEE